MFRDLFNGVPKLRLLKILTIPWLFALGDCIITLWISKTVELSGLEAIPKFLAVLFVILLGQSAVEFVGDMNDILARAEIENNIALYYLNELYKIKPEILKKNNTGYICGVVQKLAERQSLVVSQITAEVPITLMFTFYWSILVLQYDVILGLIIPVLYTCVSIFRTVWKIKVQDKPIKSMVEAEGMKTSITIDLISNINTLQKMQALDFAKDRLKTASDTSFRLTRFVNYLSEIAFILSKYTLFAYTIFIMSIVYLRQDTALFYNATFLALIVAISIKIPHNARGVYKAITNYSNFSGTLATLKKIVTHENIRHELSGEEFKCAEIVNCKYSYTDISKNRITIDIPYFCLNKGDTICVHGESGQGKTTLLHILSQEIETDTVRLNGVFSTDRLDCVFIAQDTEILNMSLRDNLTLGRNVSDEQLIYFLNTAGLGSWFNSQSEGLDTVLGERGVFVSTGQRQRLNLIRGLLMSDKEVFLLDEPTSNVDEETEEKLIKFINICLKDKTVVIVTHRPAIMEICNKLYLFENGILREE